MKETGDRKRREDILRVGRKREMRDVKRREEILRVGRERKKDKYGKEKLREEKRQILRQREDI